MKSFLFFISFGVLFQFVLSCATRSFNTSDPKIVGGREVVATDKAATSTVALVFNDATLPECTGVLVEKNIVLTALHCIRLGVDFPGLNPQKNKIKIRFPSIKNPANHNDRLVVREKTFRDLENQDLYPSFDVAFLEFEGALPEGYAPVKILGDETKIKPGMVVTLAGFGATKTEGDVDGKRRLVDVKVMRYLSEPIAPGLIFFEAAPGKGNCGGDSGGPMFATIDGEFFLVGTTNGLAIHLKKANVLIRTCEQGVGIYAFSGQYLNWLKESTKLSFQNQNSPKPLASTWGTQKKFHTDFKSWCTDNNLDRAQHATTRFIMEKLEVFSCDEAVKKIDTMTELFIAPSNPALSADTMIQDLAPLAAIPNLVKLNVFNATIESPEVLSRLKKLKTIEIIDARLTQLKLEGLSQLEMANFQSNFLTDVTLKDLPNLKMLDLSRNNLTAIPKLENVGQLSELNLTENKIKQLAGLELLENLQTVTFDANRLAGPIVLPALSKLKTVSVEKNFISDVDASAATRSQLNLSISANPFSLLACKNKFPNCTDSKAFSFSGSGPGKIISKAATVVKTVPSKSSGELIDFQKCSIPAGTEISFRDFTAFESDMRLTLDSKLSFCPQAKNRVVVFPGHFEGPQFVFKAQ